MFWSRLFGPNPDKLVQRGRARARTGELEAARELFEQALAVDPHCASALHHRAMIWFEAGDMPAARQGLLDALQAEPDLFDAMGALATAHLALGALDEAESVYVQFLTRAPPDAPGRRQIHHRLHQLRGGEAPPDEALTRALTDRAVALAQGGDLPQALLLFEELVTLCPNDAEARYNLAGNLFRLKRFQPAQSEFQRALTLDPHHLDARTGLALALQALGQHEDATEQFRRFLDEAPSNQPTRAGVERKLQHSLTAIGAASPSPRTSTSEQEIRARLMKTAAGLGLIDTDDFGFIDEMVPVFRRGSAEIARAIIQLAERSGSIHGGLVHHAFAYVFAKAVEGVVRWGMTTDGRTSVFYDPKDLLELDYRPEVPEALVAPVLATRAQAQPLFTVFQDNMLAHDPPPQSPERSHAQLRVALDTVSSIGVAYALQRGFHER